MYVHLIKQILQNSSVRVTTEYIILTRKLKSFMIIDCTLFKTQTKVDNFYKMILSSVDRIIMETRIKNLLEDLGFVDDVGV